MWFRKGKSTLNVTATGGVYVELEDLLGSARAKERVNQVKKILRRRSKKTSANAGMSPKVA